MVNVFFKMWGVNNSCQNGHLTFQLSAGPTFGDRTREVIDYCKTKKLFLINHLLNIDVR